MECFGSEWYYFVVNGLFEIYLMLVVLFVMLFWMMVVVFIFDWVYGSFGEVMGGIGVVYEYWGWYGDMGWLVVVGCIILF